MGGACMGGAPARVRIKGRTASCLRFASIAVAFMMGWILISSELGYYSKLYGPQILLQLALAFAVPSIPVLVITGEVEKVLDRELGPTQSMALRLIFGLAGCTACCAVFPFIPDTRASLLWLVVVLGVVSSIAFSTSYQLAQWFRHADIIALGIGGVVTGPLVLVLQLILKVGPGPIRWQWIAMFEITTFISALGLVSASSLFAQYWKVLTGEEEYVDPRRPLLLGMEEAQDQEECEEERREARYMTLARMRTLHLVLPPDPILAYGVLTPGDIRWPDEDDHGVPRLKTVASAGSLDHGGIPATDVVTSRRVRVLRAAASLPGRLSPVKLTKLGVHCTPEWQLPSPDAQHTRSSCYGKGPAAWHAETASIRQQSQPAMLGIDESESQKGVRTTASVTHPSAGTVGTCNSAFMTADAQTLSNIAEGLPDDRPDDSPTAPLTAAEETCIVVKYAGQVLIAFLVSVTIMYLMFPFFTYVQSSGLIGQELPKVLFFVRIFADLLGRFLPRLKVLMIRSAPLLSAVAVFKIATCTLFFVYIKAPLTYQHDALSIAFIVVIWFLGGYINTSANILAPSLVPPEVVSRASALLALIFQVAHFLGLVLAVIMAWWLYGSLIV